MKRVIILSGCCLLAVIGLMLWGFAFEDRPDQARRPGYCLLLVEEDTGSELFQLSRGLREALGRFSGQSLRVERLADHPPEKPSPLLLGARAIYLLVREPEPLLPALRALNNPLTVLNRAIPGESCVLSDVKLGGSLLGELALSLPEGRLLIVGEEADPRQALRLQGIREALKGRSHELIAPIALTGEALRGAAGVLALSGEGMGQAAALLGGLQDGQPRLYGFDAVESRVRLMEAGLLTAVAADSPYALGFVAGRGGAGIRLIPPRLVESQDLYLAENVQLMFPLIN